VINPAENTAAFTRELLRSAHQRARTRWELRPSHRKPGV
jgi:hypothetical protein